MGRVTKAIRFEHSASAELKSLLEQFRVMCNDAIRTALEAKPRSRFDLQAKAYPRLKSYGLSSAYAVRACEVAYSVYRNRNRKIDPRIKRPFLLIDNQTYRLNHLILRIPTTPWNYLYLTLRASNYHLSLLDDPTLKRGSVTITDRSIIIALSKEIAAVDPLGNLGIDVNEMNVTISDTLGNTQVYDISRVPATKELYRAIRAKIGERTGRDRRISQGLYAKYGRREKNRTVQALHLASKAIVSRAGQNRLAISMENLKGIRKLYRKGNGQTASYRGRLNTWTFREIQRQVEYKAKWAGIPVIYVSARGTSRNCSKCNSRLEPLENRQMLCRRCGTTWDRDVNASRNIMAALVRADRPSRGGCEWESRRQEKAGNPTSG